MYTISPYLAEFLGTLIMCTIGCGVIANVELRRSKGHGDNFFTIAFGWASPSPSASTPPTPTPAAT